MTKKMVRIANGQGFWGDSLGGPIRLVAKGGGGTETQKTDAQGKVHGLAMLHMELDVPSPQLD